MASSLGSAAGDVAVISRDVQAGPSDANRPVTLTGPSGLAGLVSTIRRNLDTEPDEAWYQRKVFADNLSVPALPRLRALTAEKGQALLEQLAAWMAEHDLDEHPELEGPGGGRAGIGIYYFEEESEETPS